MKRTTTLLMIVLGAALSACGGGGDSSSTIVDPGPVDATSFATTGSINGTSAAELSLKPGDSKQITIDSGADVRVTADPGVSWDAQTNGAVLGVKTFTVNEWHATISADTTTPVRLVVTLGKKTATLDITVNAQKYSPPQYKVGTQWTIHRQKTSGTSTLTYDDSFQIVAVNADNSFFERNQYGDQLRYKPGEQYYGWTNSKGDYRCDWVLPWDSIFPLQVGKKGGGSIVETCAAPGNPQETMTTRYDYTYEVIGVETLTIAGTKLKTLKLSETSRITDIVFSGTTSSAVGDTGVATRWWSPDWGIFVLSIVDDTTATSTSHTLSGLSSYKP